MNKGLFQYDSTAQTFPFADGIAPWHKNEPNDGGSGDEDCVCMNKYEEMFIGDVICKPGIKSYHSICELPSYPTSTGCPRAECFFFNLALRERRMQVRFDLKLSVGLD